MLRHEVIGLDLGCSCIEWRDAVGALSSRSFPAEGDACCAPGHLGRPQSLLLGASLREVIPHCENHGKPKAKMIGSVSSNKRKNTRCGSFNRKTFGFDIQSLSPFASPLPVDHLAVIRRIRLAQPLAPPHHGQMGEVDRERDERSRDGKVLCTPVERPRRDDIVLASAQL